MFQFLPFVTWLQQQAAAAQAACLTALDFSVGSVLRALFSATAGVALWLQWLIVQVLALTRAATSAGVNLDSWMADFFFTRLQAVASSGNVTFARFTPTNAALVPVGAQVKTADGTQVFAVVANTANALWSVALSGYLIPAGTVSAVLPVVALVAGAAGNVAAGTITLIATAISGVDTCTNAAAFTNGQNGQTDPAFRAAFQGYINTRAQATTAAVIFAVQQLGQNLTVSVAENVTPAGVPQNGYFVVTVDNGTGYPPSSLLTAASVAVNAVRPIGSVFYVQAPTVVGVTISFAITPAAGYLLPPLDAAAALAVTAYVNALPVGAGLSFLRLAQVIFDSTPGIADVTNLLLNSGTADIPPVVTQVVRATSVAAN